MEHKKHKVHFNEITEGTQMREEKIYIIGDRKFWADRTNKNNLATHKDCKECGKEFEFKYSRDICDECQLTEYNKQYLDLKLVEWDGKMPLTLWHDDGPYFFDPSDILEYCEEQEIDLSDLKLVTCYQTSFAQVDILEAQMEVVHENWEPDNELSRLITDLEEYLDKADTKTWMPSNNRVSLTMEDFK